MQAVVCRLLDVSPSPCDALVRRAGYRGAVGRQNCLKCAVCDIIFISVKFKLANLLRWKHRKVNLSGTADWLDLLDDFGPALLRFVIDERFAATIPESEPVLSSFRESMRNAPLSSLKPIRGSVWILFAFKDELVSLPEPFRKDGILLPFSWVRGKTRSSVGVPKALEELALKVRGQCGDEAKGWSLSPAEYFGCTVDFEFPGATFDSSWGALASGLYLALNPEVKFVAWPFSTIAFDFEHGEPVSVGNLDAKFRVAVSFGADEIAVAPVQQAAAAKRLSLLQACYPNDSSLSRLRIFPWHWSRDWSKSLSLLVSCNQRKNRVKIEAKVLLKICLGLMVLGGVGFWGISWKRDREERYEFYRELRKIADITEKRPRLTAKKEGPAGLSAIVEDNSQTAKCEVATSLAADEVKAGDVKTIFLPGGAMMKMVWCPPCPQGFWMGSPDSEDQRHDDETRHLVKLTKGFWIGQYEVTQGQWKSVMGYNPSANRRGDDWPVEQVSWRECQQFVTKVNAERKYSVSLPTEAQWEYACRAGMDTPFGIGLTLNGNAANCDGNYPYGMVAAGPYLGHTTRVGSYRPNAWNIYDMHGNVWEWCEDCYDSDFYINEASKVDPCCMSGSLRVDRGGGWGSSARFCRSAERGRYGAGRIYERIGFRIVSFEEHAKYD